jgi:hypothetical protein
MASVCIRVPGEGKPPLNFCSSREGIHTTEIELATKILDSNGKYYSLYFSPLIVAS